MLPSEPQHQDRREITIRRIAAIQQRISEASPRTPSLGSQRTFFEGPLRLRLAECEQVRMKLTEVEAQIANVRAKLKAATVRESQSIEGQNLVKSLAATLGCTARKW